VDGAAKGRSGAKGKEFGDFFKPCALRYGSLAKASFVVIAVIVVG
jgi:hypothetical protein